MSKISLGTVQFGLNYGVSKNRKVSFLEVGRILDYARLYGVNMLDTASNYGSSEQV